LDNLVTRPERLISEEHTRVMYNSIQCIVGNDKSKNTLVMLSRLV